MLDYITKSPLPTSKPLISSMSEGLRLTNSLLSFDAEGEAQLNFLSSAALYSPKKFATSKQIITSEQTVKLLEALGHRPIDALVCQFNRPFSIGKFRLELLPTGNMLGAANLYLETNNYNLIYAPTLQNESINIFKKMNIRPANILLLGCFNPEPQANYSSRKKEKGRLIQAVDDIISQGKTPVILCKPYNTAPEVTRALVKNGFPVAVHSNIFKINRIYDAYGAQLGKYSFYSRRYTKNKVIIFPTTDNMQLALRKPLPTGEVIIIDDKSTNEIFRADALRPVQHHFTLNTQVDGSELKNILQQIIPQEVYLFGPYIDRYEKVFDGFKNIQTKRLNVANQGSLF